MKKTVIIAAGGQGIRMGTELPKQFLPLEGRPLLMHTLDLFFRYEKSILIIVGLSEKYHKKWEELCREEDFRVPHLVVAGGETRFHTIQHALGQVPRDCLVAIHDAVRPLVSRATLDRCFETALRTGAAIPCVAVPDTLRQIGPDEQKTVDRQFFRLVQTPQVFHSDILQNAYRQTHREEFTDDASVVEKAGYPVSMVEGNHENIKITTPEDLVYARSIMGSFRKKSGWFQ